MILIVLKTAWRAIIASKMRSFLTMLGIIIGISSVILVMAIGEGTQKLIVSEVSKMGTDLIGILPGKTEDGIPAAAMGQVVTTLKKEDAEAIGELKGIKAATGYVAGRATVSFGKEALMFDFTGVSPDYLKIENASLSEGYFFTDRQAKGFSRVAVIGWQVKEDLFRGQNPIGQNINLKGNSFKVIGVIEKRGSQLLGNPDTQIFVPLSTAQKVLLGISHVNFIRAKLADGSSEAAMTSEIENLLRRQHQISDPAKDDFTVRSMKQMISILAEITGAIQGFLVLVVAVSLLVGGIGIMNIMLVSLSERIREIGIRKALGATDKNVLAQFLIESSLLSFIGGIIGIILGVGLAAIGSYLINALTSLDWSFVISTGQIILSASVALAVGIVFGLYPGIKAAKLNPIEALRYE